MQIIDDGDNIPRFLDMVETPMITHRHTLPKEMIDIILNTPFSFGYEGLSEFVYYRTYSQRKDNGKRECFPETVVRVITGVISIQKDYRIKHGLYWDENRWNDIAFRMAMSMMKIQFLPPGRGLWISGTEYSYTRGSSAFNNCGFISCKEGLIKATCWTMDMLMCGCGIGFDTNISDEELNSLVIPTKLHRSKKYIIHDSREGWVKSVMLLLESYFDGIYIEFDYSRIREEGVFIKGFGGTSSGPEPLRILHERIRIYTECYIKCKTLNTYDTILSTELSHLNIFTNSNPIEISSVSYAIDCLQKLSDEQKSQKTYGKSRYICDVFNSIGICVVVGNVRRSSQISLGDVTDTEFANLKNHTLNPERCAISWMSNNTVCFNKTEDFELLPSIANRIRDNGEPGCFNRLNVNRFGRIGVRHPIGRESEEDKAIGLNPCLTGDTIISTDQGFKTIFELVGKKFNTVLGYNSTSEGFWSTGIKRVYKLTLQSGNSIKLTNNHKLLTLKEDENELWKELKECSIFEKMCIYSSGTYYDLVLNEDYIKGYVYTELLSLSMYKDSLLYTDINSIVFKFNNENLSEEFMSNFELIPNRRTSFEDKDIYLYCLTEKGFEYFRDEFNLESGIFYISGSRTFNLAVVRYVFFYFVEKNVSFLLINNLKIESLIKIQLMLLDFGIFSELNHELVCLTIKHENIIRYQNLYDNFVHNIRIKEMNYELDYSRNYSYIKSIDYIGEEEVYDCSIPGVNRFVANGFISHNCGEIPLESGELCNLAELFPSRCNTEEELREATYLATIYSTTVSLFPTHWASTNSVIARNHRIGISMTGIVNQVDKTSVMEFTKLCKSMYKLVRQTNTELSNECGVPCAIRCTTVKPSGTISQLAGEPSGVHRNLFRHCIRRVRVGATTELATILKKTGYHYEDDKAAGASTLVFSFPLKLGDERIAEEVSVWEQACMLELMQRVWADNSVSCTLYFNKKEEHQIEHVLSHFIPLIKSVSMLPHLGKGVYEQSPYEEITEEEYNEMKIKITSPNSDYENLTSTPIGVKGCDGDRCEM